MFKKLLFMFIGSLLLGFILIQFEPIDRFLPLGSFEIAQTILLLIILYYVTKDK